MTRAKQQTNYASLEDRLAKQTTLKPKLDLQVSLSTVSLESYKYRKTEDCNILGNEKIFEGSLKQQFGFIFTMKAIQQHFDISI